MDGQILHGWELIVVFAKENRKKPTEMRERERGGRDSVYNRRWSPRYSQSPATRNWRSTSHSRDYYSPPPRRRYSRYNINSPPFHPFYYLFDMFTLFLLESRSPYLVDYSREPGKNGSPSR
ncbi:serine arginine-rich SC35-like splicing factor SCL30A [Olea europaea subsp. europaea]|uniref:Serine arginine-rich SC35-like splicing factor SCL30A n=1 Tax=Olea europaea subsp. europaea TaxID=158383 RepID=A0A8S0P6P4_OLEEU|nr:serine arginine-rich SC35-like splicing factor SCL30A [Olea europaea subsp. europaea]